MVKAMTQIIKKRKNINITSSKFCHVAMKYKIDILPLFLSHKACNHDTAEVQ
jgi:hypothetical protein